MENAAVGFDDCRRELLDRAGGEAPREYRSWRKRPGYGEVVEFVENFTHRYLFEITPEQARAVIDRSTGPLDHALGDVASREQMREVENATVPFAFQHLFHRYIEEQRALPSWREFGAWLKGPAARYWLEPLMSKTGYYESDDRRRKRLGRAYRWRAGKAYYSAFREVELLARLRTDYGLDVRYHVLADVLLGVDFWLDDVLTCVYFPNEKYRAGEAGRKVHASARFAAADPPFKVMDVPVERQGYGKFWLVGDDSAERIALSLRRAQADADGGARPM